MGVIHYTNGIGYDIYTLCRSRTGKKTKITKFFNEVTCEHCLNILYNKIEHNKRINVSQFCANICLEIKCTNLSFKELSDGFYDLGVKMDKISEIELLTLFAEVLKLNVNKEDIKISMESNWERFKKLID